MFTPTKAPAVKLLRNVKLEVSPERYAELQAIATAHGVSLRELLRQSVDYAIANLTPPVKP